MPKCRIDWAQLGIFYLMFLLLHHFDPFYVHKIRFHKYVKFRIKYVVWAAKPKWPYACEQKASWFSVFGSLIRFAFFGNGVFFCNEWNSKQSKVKQSIGLNGPKSRMKSDEETHGSRQKKRAEKRQSTTNTLNHFHCTVGMLTHRMLSSHSSDTDFFFLLDAHF